MEKTTTTTTATAIPPPPIPESAEPPPLSKPGSATTPTNQPPPSSPDNGSSPVNKAIRHAEKRRTSTCRFADKVAQCSVDFYHRHIPKSFRDSQKQTCLSTIVAAFYDHGTARKDDDNDDEQQQRQVLKVLAVGVGTKFLREQTLREEEHDALHETSCTPHDPYGSRVRDCHAEVLARRAFRRYLTEQMMILVLQRQEQNIPLSSSSSLLLELTNDHSFRLKPGVTLHMYCSSTPCGNSSIKKFGTFVKERFRNDLDDNMWPPEPHVNMLPGHSIPLGQFALLVKRDPEIVVAAASSGRSGDDNDDNNDNNNDQKTTENSYKHNLSPKQQSWPMYTTTDWCPPGTTTVWANRGSLHTCSDKIARWNILGLQGSLLSYCLENNAPLYMSSLTVGRKLSNLTCRRAVCCRCSSMIKNKKGNHWQRLAPPPQRHPDSGTASTANHDDESRTSKGNVDDDEDDSPYRLCHPAIMGTAVYMDEDGVVDTSSSTTTTTTTSGGKNNNQQQSHVRFYNNQCWVAWLDAANDDYNESEYSVECIDGSTGFLYDDDSSNNGTDDEQQRRRPRYSMVSTWELTKSFLQIIQMRDENKELPRQTTTRLPRTLPDLRALKLSVAPEYERVKASILEDRSSVLGEWRRRQDDEHATTLQA